MDRICYVCNIRKDISLFPVDKKKGGYSYRCFECENKLKLEKKRHYADYNQKYLKEYKKEYVVGTDRARKYQENYRDRGNQDKILARKLVNNAIKSGVLKPLPCCICGKKAQAHHEDYSKPLEVIWFCKQHHEEHHHKESDNV